MSKLLLPALRGHIGDWVFYSCIMPLVEVGRRVSYADEIHRSRHLSDMIQRELREGRAREIKEYLATQEQRFFNSLVLAVYDSNPVWYPIREVAGRYREIGIELSEERTQTLGLLELSSKLTMFAIDGQHRLSGIKLLLEEKRAFKDDELPIVLVGHKRTAAGFERSRRLFTTLNKTAKKVSKGEIIALDEDDVGAIVVRRLVEEHPNYSGKRIAFQPSNNLPPSNRQSLTTLGNLYDLIWLIIRKIRPPANGVPDLLVRPTDECIQECQQIVIEFFDGLGRRFPPIGRFFKNKQHGMIVASNRHAKGGHILFRPVGLEIFTNLIVELCKDREVEAALDLVAQLPVELGKKPYAGILWDSGRKVMALTGKTSVQDLLRLAVGLPVKRSSVRKRLAGRLGEAVVDVDLSEWIPDLKAKPVRKSRQR